MPVIDISLDMSDHPFELCSKCNRKKYSPATKGFFPQFVKKPPEGLEIFKSRESFGYGTESFNRIFISKNIWEEFKKIKINPNIWPLRP